MEENENIIIENMSDEIEVDLDAIPQDWLDTIQKAFQYMGEISHAAFVADNDHLFDVSRNAFRSMGQVINLIDPDRYYSISENKIGHYNS